MCLFDLCQEFWASDLSRVREFLTGYMRRGPQVEPMLQLDEVTIHKHTNERKSKLRGFLTSVTSFF